MAPRMMWIVAAGTLIGVSCGSSSSTAKPTSGPTTVAPARTTATVATAATATTTATVATTVSPATTAGTTDDSADASAPDDSSDASAPDDTAGSEMSDSQVRQLMVDLVKRTCKETGNQWTKSPQLFATASEYRKEGHPEYKLTDNTPLSRLKTAFFEMYGSYDAAQDVTTLPAGFCSGDIAQLVAALPASYLQS